MRHVYQWMTVGLLVTAGTAFFVASSPALLSAIFGNTFGLIILAIAVFAMPLVLSGMISRLSAFAATALFVVYSALMGAFLSSVLLVYTGASVMSTFVTCAAMFGGMSIYGTVTKRDLTGMGSFMMMGLFGLIIAMIVNIFLQSSAMTFVISALGVVIFTGLTAYDTQDPRLRRKRPLDDATAIRRGALLGALTLYLDFINLFLMLLRLMGDRLTDRLWEPSPYARRSRSGGQGAFHDRIRDVKGFFATRHRKRAWLPSNASGAGNAAPSKKPLRFLPFPHKPRRRRPEPEDGVPPKAGVPVFSESASSAPCGPPLPFPCRPRCCAASWKASSRRPSTPPSPSNPFRSTRLPSALPCAASVSPTLKRRERPTARC
ncbi:MAG: Bax inhibitor-1/YccA family protein [Bilophila wadsworthia]